jgi:hypothetical protein
MCTPSLPLCGHALPARAAMPSKSPAGLRASKRAVRLARPRQASRTPALDRGLRTSRGPARHGLGAEHFREPPRAFPPRRASSPRDRRSARGGMAARRNRRKKRGRAKTAEQAWLDRIRAELELLAHENERLRVLARVLAEQVGGSPSSGDGLTRSPRRWSGSSPGGRETKQRLGDEAETTSRPRGQRTAMALVR